MTKSSEYIIRNRFADRPEPLIHDRFTVTPEARFALACIERWGMVAAVPDGEDTAGRQKLRRMTPSELAVEACNISDQAFGRFRELGWLIEVPSWEELVAKAGEMDEKRLNDRSVKK